MRRELNQVEAQVWAMHFCGMPISEIAAETKLDEGFIRATITGIWRDDGQVVRNAA